MKDRKGLEHRDMAEIGRVSIRLPSTIQQGDVIRVRSLVIHPMELVQRDKQGEIIRRNYNFIHTVAVSFNGKEVMRAETTQAITQNPIFTFPVKVDRPGKLTVSFTDTTGKTYAGNAEVKFS
jgi:sulfur-oxidizing protein SoxZ